MAEKDLHVKKMLEDKACFADLFNGVLFHGKQIIKPELLEQMTVESGVLTTDKQGMKRVVQRQRDVKMKASLSGGVCFSVILCEEGQSDIHYAMPVRNMLYDALDYAEQIEETDRERKARGEKLTGPEYLSGLGRGECLMPVITLVWYWGRKQWDGPVELHQMLGFDNCPEEAGAIRDFIPNYKINLINPQNMEDMSVFRTCLQQIFSMVKYNSDKTLLYQYVKENREQLGSLTGNEMNALLALLGEQKRLAAIMKNQGEKEGMDVCRAIDELIEDGKREGEIKGEIKGQIKGEERFAKLNLLLMADKRYDDLERASKDREYRRQLFDTFGI